MASAVTVTASEFRQNFGKYAALVRTQDFEITRNGKVIALWTNPAKDKIALAQELAGSIHAEIDFAAEQAKRRERL